MRTGARDIQRRSSSSWKQEELEEAGTKCSHLPGAQNLEQESLVQSQLGTQQDPTQPFLSLLQTKMVNLCCYLIRSRIIRETSSGHVCGDIILVKLIRWEDSYTLGGTILGLGS